MADIIIKGRVPSKKNSRITTRSGRTFPSKKYTQWHKDASIQLLFQVTGKDFTGVYGVEISFWMPDNRRKDLTNAAESIMDLLVDCGVLKDDCWQEIKHVLLACEGIDRKNPRAEIWIKRSE